MRVSPSQHGLVIGNVNPVPASPYKVVCTSTTQTEQECESQMIHFGMAKWMEAEQTGKRAALTGWTRGYYRIVLFSSAN